MCLDMVWGFSQIVLDEESQKILVVVARSGLKRWKYLPMGPKQGPGMCQSFVDEAFGDIADMLLMIFMWATIGSLST